MRGRLAAEHIIARGSALNRALVEYAVADGGTPRMKYVVGGSLDSVSASGFALDSATVQATYAQPSGTVELAVFQDSGYVYRAGVDFLLSLDSSEVRWRTVSLQLDSAHWVSAVPGAFRWGKRGMHVQQSRSARRLGGTDLRATENFPSSGPMNLDLDVHWVADRESRRAGGERSRGNGSH